MITVEQVRTAICCPGGCQESRHCARNMKHIREAADAVMKLVAPEATAEPAWSFMWGAWDNMNGWGVPLSVTEPRARAEEKAD